LFAGSLNAHSHRSVQLADALAPAMRLMNALHALLAIEPQHVGDHPLARRLAAENDAMQLAQLLRRHKVGPKSQ
jgi:hypothetical protein